MGILIISAVFPPEPLVTANLSFDIADKLAINYDVLVVSPKPTRPFGISYKKNDISSFRFTHKVLKTYTNPQSSFTGRTLESYSLGRATKDYIIKEQKNIDLIYANTWPVFAQLFLIRTAKKLEIPVVLHIQDIYPESITNKMYPFIGNLVKKLLLPIDKYVLQNAKRVIAISQQMKDVLVTSRCLESSKVTVVRNWQNDEKFINSGKENNLVRSETFTFMYLGSLSPSAGVELLIESFVATKPQNIRLVIAGGGSDKDKCINIAKQHNDARIEFWDAPLEKVPEIQSQADILILPLKRGIGKTASPSKLPAYMFSAKPIIACVDDNSDTADIILTAGCGWVLPPENIQSLSIMMNSVASLPKQELKQKGINGFNYATEHLSRAKNLQKMVDIIIETYKA